MNRAPNSVFAVVFVCMILTALSLKGETVFLDAETITTGIISLKFNSAQGGGQILKISLEVFDLEHKVLKGSGKFISLPELAEFKSVDADPETWQIVSIPVLKYLHLRARS